MQYYSHDCTTVMIMLRLGTAKSIHKQPTIKPAETQLYSCLIYVQFHFHNDIKNSNLYKWIVKMQLCYLIHKTHISTKFKYIVYKIKRWSCHQTLEVQIRRGYRDNSGIIGHICP